MGRRYGGYGYKVYNYGYYSDDPVRYPKWMIWKKLRIPRRIRKFLRGR